MSTSREDTLLFFKAWAAHGAWVRRLFAAFHMPRNVVAQQPFVARNKLVRATTTGKN